MAVSHKKNLSALAKYGAAVEAEEIKLLKLQFSTHKKAILEIRRLSERNNQLNLALGLMNYKRPKGRPKKIIIPKEITGLFGLGGTTSDRKKGGRPVEMTYDERVSLIKFIQEMKMALGNSAMTDRALFKKLAVKWEVPLSKRNLWVHERWQALKASRDITKIRQRKIG
jgi:hypothetical protein